MSSASKSRAVLLANGVDVSWRTVSRRLVNDFGLKSRKPAKKTRLTPAMKAKCLAFVKKHVNWTIQQGHHVLFSDESTVQQFTTRKRYICWPTGKRCDKRYTTQTMKHPSSVMIRGGISANGKAGLCFRPSGTTMNGQKHVDLQKDKLELHMAVHKFKIFMQDGAHAIGPKLFLSSWSRKKFRSCTPPGPATHEDPPKSIFWMA